MQVIEELLYQKTAQGLDWFFSVWWYSSMTLFK